MTNKPAYDALEKRVRELESAESEYKKIIESLLKKEKRYRTLFEYMLHEIHVWELIRDEYGNIKTWRLVDANPAALKSWGMTLPEIVGKITDEIFPNTNGTELFMPIIKKIFAEGTPHIWENYIPDTNQHLHMISIPHGEYFISTGLDITERKQAEKALEEERSFLTAVLDNIQDAIVISNEEGKLIRFNEAARQLHGLPEQPVFPDQWAGQYDLYQIDGQTPLPMNEIPLFRASQGEKVDNAEIMVAPQNSEPRFMTCNGQSIHDPEGKQIGAVVAMHDVTERKKKENALQESEERHRLLFENASMGIGYFTTDGRVVAFNDRALNSLGGQLEDFVGKSLVDIFGQDSGAQYIERINKVCKTSEILQFEDCVPLPSGNVWFLSAYRRIIDTSGKLKGVQVISQDITELKNAEGALRESELKWRNILVNTPQIGISLDPKGKIVFANRRFLELTKWEHADVIGQDWFDLFIPEPTREEIRNFFSYTMSRKDDLDFSNYENEILTKSGSVLNVSWSNLVTKDSQGGIVDVTCLGVDLTERKKYEMLLEKKNTDLRLAQRIASIGTWTLDPEVGVPEWSEEIYRIYERDPNLGPYPVDEYRKIYRGEWWEKFHLAIKGAIVNGTPYDIELKLEFSSGKEKWIHAICEPDSEIGPKGHKVRGTIQDITEKKQTEEALRQAHKMEAIGTLAGGIAHEFNNMLGIIIGNTELAIDDIPEWNPATDCIQEIRTASLRAKDVVRKLLSVARKSPESRKLLQIRTIVDESLNLFRKTMPASIEIRSNLACTTEMILADPTEINQVLLNLCTNSVHAMADGKGILEVTLKTKTLNAQSVARFENISPGNFVKLTVSDDGKGMAPDILDRIFEPYFTTKDVDEGLGMGLAVVHGIVQKHEGEIIVESEVGIGTTVQVLFPLIEGQPVPSDKKIETLPKGTERILLIDDEAALVKMVTQMLTRYGYEVVGKTSSAEALKVFKKSPDRFNLVITDMTMPEMTGDEITREIIQVRPDIPVILCTGHSDHMDENEAKERGIKAFVMKPLGKADLTKTVRKVLDEVNPENQD